MRALSKLHRALSYLLALLGLSCALPSSPSTPIDVLPVVWFRTSNTSPKGVILTLHGLNNKPQVMSSFCQFFQAEGFHVLQVSLSGHEHKNLDVTEEHWLQDIANAVSEAQRQYPNLPFYNISYSLGSLVTTAYLDHQQKSPFKKMIFLAPAIRPNVATSLIRLLSPLRVFGFSLPSFAPSSYRAHRSTPLAFYNSLFILVDQVQTLQNPITLNEVPTKIVIAKNDELVSTRSLRTWVEKNALFRWQVEIIKPQPTSRLSYRHLIIDKQTLGEKEWDRLTKEISDFFKEPSSQDNLPTEPSSGHLQKSPITPKHLSH